jgi:hypothetical protein
MMKSVKFSIKYQQLDNIQLLMIHIFDDEKNNKQTNWKNFADLSFVSVTDWDSSNQLNQWNVWDHAWSIRLVSKSQCFESVVHVNFYDFQFNLHMTHIEVYSIHPLTTYVYSTFSTLHLWSLFDNCILSSLLLWSRSRFFFNHSSLIWFQCWKICCFLIDATNDYTDIFLHCIAWF